ncbi:MAG: Flp pilus assembly complex ATPase component TadA, partial [Deltaproteobacteria bacterium]|nr:Flp pilus assembly complex ATPase component TadA [Deltaproteobacteria bacterium]
MKKANTNLNEEGLSIKYVVDVLLKRRLISAEDHKEVIIRGDTQRARLSKSQDSFYTRSRLQSVASLVSPAEVISSFEWEMPDSNGKTLTEDIITKALAEELKLPYIKIDPLKLDLDIVTTHIPRAFAQRHLIVPVEEKDGLLAIAIADPFDREATENLSRTTNLKIKLVLASKGDILKIVREFYGFRSSVDAAKKEKGGGVGVELGNLEQFVKLRGTKDIEANDQHVVNAVDYLLKYAYDQRASDIHIEPKRENSHVRLRIDGMLHHIHTIPKVVHPSMVSRIKMLSRMDIAEKRRPQDGRIKTEHNGKEIELRVSTMPTAFGEKIVIRIFDPQILFQELKDLG